MTMRRQYLRCTALGMLALLGTLQIAPAQQKLPSEPVQALDNALEALFARDLSPGMAIAVVRGTEVIYARGFGFADIEQKRPVTPDTIFYIGSTTKSFTGFAAALLHHRKQINLDSSIEQYLPALRLKPPLSASAITVRDLLTHTHGIEDGGPIVFRTAYSGRYDSDLLIRMLGTYAPSPQGRAFHYGNLGYNVTGLVLDRQEKGGWKQLQEREIFVPLQMKDTTAYVSRADQRRLAMPYAAEKGGYRRLRYAKTDATMHAAGGHLSTAQDLARWVLVHLNGGNWKASPVFPSEVIAETHRIQAKQDRDFGPFHRIGWGLGWDIGTYDGDVLIHRFGSFPGFRSHVSFMPERGLGVVVLTNESSLGSALADLAAVTAYDIFLAKDSAQEKREKALAQAGQMATQGRESMAAEKARRAARPQQLAHPLRAYAGTFQNDALGCMQWRLEGGVLQAQIGDAQSTAEVFDGSKDQLRVELTGSGEVVSFNFEGKRPRSLKYAGQEFRRSRCR